jgi:hypothetical protein
MAQLLHAVNISSPRSNKPGKEFKREFPSVFQPRNLCLDHVDQDNLAFPGLASAQ